MPKNKKIIIIISAVVLILFFSFLCFLFLKAPASNSIKTDFEIKPQTSSSQIATSLKEKNLIRSKWLFLITKKLEKGKIDAGIYELSPSYNLLKTIDILTNNKIKENVVTFPEGFDIKDMAERLQEKDIVKKDDFLQEASQITKYKTDFPFLLEVKTSNLEGYLFPDTYRLAPNVTSYEIIQKMLSDFNNRIDDNIRTEITNQGKSLYDVIILASIVEREAKKDEDRPIIASVYLNRLAKNMNLEADPTIQYAKGSWQPITAKDYQAVDSPYNTYKNAGLPPGPITNPGLASIKAVIYPAKTDYLYFFTDKNGNNIYSVTPEEHEQKQKEY